MVNNPDMIVFHIPELQLSYLSQKMTKHLRRLSNIPVKRFLFHYVLMHLHIQQHILTLIIGARHTKYTKHQLPQYRCMTYPLTVCFTVQTLVQLKLEYMEHNSVSAPCISNLFRNWILTLISLPWIKKVCLNL